MYVRTKEPIPPCSRKRPPRATVKLNDVPLRFSVLTVVNSNLRESAAYNSHMPIPAQFRGQKYLLLTTFRKNGAAVPTPVWFAEENGKLYVKTRADTGKTKRIRNNPQVRIAPCTIRGKVTGPEFPASARILPAEDSPHANQVINRKYWMARLSLWNHKNAYLEISL
jgi:uncharacterized protein